MKNKLSLGLMSCLMVVGFFGFGQTSITTVADSYIQGGTDADTNFGTLDIVIKSAGTTERVTRHGFVKFDLTSLSTELAIAKLVLTVKDDEVNGFEAFMVSDDSWTETGLTWNNAPAAGVSLGVQTNTLSNPTLEWNIRKEVLAELATDKTITIKIVGTAHNVFSNLHSKESTSVEAEKPTIVYEEGEVVQVVSIVVEGVDGIGTVGINKSIQMTSVASPSNATNSEVVWSVTAGTGAATIDSDGVLIGVSEGTVTVKATATDDSGVVGEKEITVTKTFVTSLTVDGIGGSSETNVGSTLQMTASVLPADASDPSVSWMVTDGTGSATINASGFLVGVTVGTVTVTATANDGSQVSDQKEIVINEATPGVSSLVTLDDQGNLSYLADETGNIIPDFSMVGYHQGDIMIPHVPVKVTLAPGTGDRRSDIQNAINTVAAMSPDANGHRGAVLLQAGYYAVSDVLNVNSSGIVIRGEGKGADGTVVELTATKQADLFHFKGSGSPSKNSSTEKRIMGSYVPIGAKTVTVASGHSFQIGDRVLFTLTTNAAFLAEIGMDQLVAKCGSGHSNWSTGSMDYKRKVIAIEGDLITLDAPVVDPVDSRYNTATLAKYTWSGKIEECGIENIRLQSSYASETDEDHGWSAVSFSRIENSWASNVDSYYFGYAAIETVSDSYQITVQDCGMFEYKSVVTGARRYGFYSDDCDLVLFQNCTATEGRHDFVQGSQTPGPNVYLNCSSKESTNDVGPHLKWSTGTLWDNVITDKAINVQNRMCSGSGHGWSGAQQVFWNCSAPKMVVMDPPTNATNWAIGCTANITNIGDFDGVVEPLGVVESQNAPIAAIPSLYQAQLRARYPIAAPADLMATVDDNQIVLTWTDNSSNEDGFVVERKENGIWERIATLDANSTTYSDTEIPVLYKYTYRVRSQLMTAVSIASNEVVLSVVLNEPSSLAAVAQNDRINLTWTDNSELEDGFLLQRKDNGVWTSIATLAANITTYTDANIPVLYDYVYRLYATLNGELSDPSNEIKVTKILHAPTNLELTVQETQIDLTWADNSSLEDGYRIERKELDSWSPLVSLDANTTTYSDTNVPTSFDYTYRVFTSLGTVLSPASNEVRAFKESVLNIPSIKSISIYPNPAKDQIVITNVENDAFIWVYNSAGQLVLTTLYRHSLDISSLESGMYFLQLSDEINKENGSLRFIKNH